MTMACVRSDIDPFPGEFLADPFPPLDDLRNAAPVVGFFRTTSEPVDLAGTLLPTTPCAAWDTLPVAVEPA